MGYVPSLGELCQIDAIQLMNLDSTNVGPGHWLEMAGAIRRYYREYDGFVFTHGTDTMAYTAAALSYLIQDSLRSPSAWTTPTPGATSITACSTRWTGTPTM